MMLAFETQGLGKSFGGRRSQRVALAGVTLSAPRGTAFGMIGPNGAGKTTFVKSLLGVVRPSAGTVIVLDGSPEDPEVRRRIGYLPERLHFSPGTTARSFLVSVARLRSLPNSLPEIRLQLARVGLEAEAERSVNGFSKGMQQRLGLAAALLGAPDFLVLDEPTDGIDPIGRANFREIIAQERSRGATIFLNSHLLTETERICDRIGILVHGSLVREGSLEAITRSHSQWQARFAANGDGELLQSIGFLPSSEEGWFDATATDEVSLNTSLDQARQRGAYLIELRLKLKTLEDVLMEAAAAGGNAA